MASSKREKELARQRAERQAARRAAAAVRRKRRSLVIAGAVAASLVVAAALGVGVVTRGGEADTVVPAADASAEPSTAPSAAPSAEPSVEPSADPVALPPGSCAYDKSSEPAARPVALPRTTGVELEKTFTITLTTNRGVIAFDIDSAKAPCTSNSIRSLAHARYFDDTPCHRLTTAGISVLQCGDPTGTGNGGPGYSFADENLDGATYPRGTVAMANAGPGTNGSQFFLVYADSSSLPPDYTPFGTITQGLDVLDTIAAGGSDDSRGSGDGKPKLPVQIKTARVALAS